MRNTWAIISACILLSGADALCQNEHPQTVLDQNAVPAKTFVLNGRTVDAKVILQNNRYFVDLEDLSRAIGASLFIRNDIIVLTLNNSTPAAAEVGRVRGTLSYYFNENYGNKPDTGSGVYLVEGRVDIDESDRVLQYRTDHIMANSKELTVVKHTAANGNGSFDLDGIKPGNYTLILISKHAKGVKPRDIEGIVWTTPIEIKSGETEDVSHDFGMSQ